MCDKPWCTCEDSAFFESALAAERALSDRLAEALKDFARWLDPQDHDARSSSELLSDVRYALAAHAERRGAQGEARAPQGRKS